MEVNNDYGKQKMKIMKVKQLDESTIKKIGHAFNYYNYGDVKAFSEKEIRTLRFSKREKVSECTAY